MLLRKLMEAIKPNADSNLIFGFRKCAIHPVDVNKLLERIPIVEPDKNAVEAAFWESLEAKRTQWTETTVPKQDRKKINVVSGKRIDHGLMNSECFPSTSTQPTDFGRRKSRKARPNYDTSDDDPMEEMCVR